MGLTDTVNRVLFNLTYNEQASKAYDEQNEKAAGAVEELKKVIEGYRKQRDKILADGLGSEYFTQNSLSRITEWENWLEKNSGLSAGDYSKKETEMKTQWDGILSSNKVVKELERVPKFLELFLKDKATTIPTAQKTELDTLKKEAEAYLKKILRETPADLVAKRDEFNRQFSEIQKKIPENFADLKESFEDAGQAPVTLLQGIEESNFKQYETQVEKKEQADSNTFSFKRMMSTIMEYFSFGFATGWPYFFGAVFAMIVANDAIGRPALYRIFYFVWMFILFQVSLVPGFPFLVFLYYIYRSFRAVNWSNVFTFHPTGPRMDYMVAPVLFAFLPIFEGRGDEKVPWYLSIFKYDVNRYGGLAKKKQMAYELGCANAVGKTLDASAFDLPESTFDEMMCELKAVVTGSHGGSFGEVLDALKKAL
jgi:hypothetical protein